ncbi:nucleotidyltransferase [Sinorhizobium medicae]|nr:nucleotidyltransferase [Sinorhizobium medicae]MQV95089.1 nucleotidyltransferase [Sinorhizobium medicae]
MSISEAFQSFLSNIAVDNTETIALRYGEITRALNIRFRDTESKTANTLQVGSYGRGTAIKGISDLDILYIMPSRSWPDYKDGRQLQLLRDTADAIRARYPNTDVRVDRLVVQVLYARFQVEVQPVFEEADGSFTYPDTSSGGSWKTTRPREELRAISDADMAKNRNVRRLCKMVRAWKNKHGVAMGGLLIDSLAHRFLNGTGYYDDKSYVYYDYMARDLFEFLGSLPDQEYFAALGSGQRVKVKKKFQKKARNAHKLCLEAIEANEAGNRNEKWRKVFGRGFPAAAEEASKAFILEGNYQARNTEEIIENKFPVDIRYPITLDCEVRQHGFRSFLLRSMLLDRLPLFTRKSLRFFVAEHGIPGRFQLYWKVLNRGTEAVRRDCIRGQIVLGNAGLEKTENTMFRGEHVVECYAVQNHVVVATDRIRVPIQEASED